MPKYLTRAEKTYYPKVGRRKYLRAKKCKNCGKSFQPNNSIRKFCSTDCAYKKRPLKGAVKQCKTCKKDFYVRPYGTIAIVYCSMKCVNDGKRKDGLKKGTRKRRICRTCKTIFYRPRSQEYWRGKGKFCSVKCRSKGKKATVQALDVMWAKFIKLRAKEMCEYCGKVGGLNAHHLFSRSNRTIRWDEDNGISLCVSHHIFGNFSAHKAPFEFAEWIKKERGLRWYNRLRKKARTVKKYDFEKVKKKLQKKLDEFDG